MTVLLASCTSPASTTGVASSTTVATMQSPATTASTAVEATTSTQTTASTAATTTTTTGTACPALGGETSEGAEITDVVLAAYPVEGGDAVWSIPLNGELISMAIGNSLLFLGSLDGVVTALDPDTCRQEWRRVVSPTALRVSATPGAVVVDGLGVLASLDPTTGEELWSVQPPIPFGVVAGVFGQGILMTVEGYGAMTFDLATGGLLLDMPFENAPLRTVTADESQVYAGGAGIIVKPVTGGDTVWESDVDADVLVSDGGLLFGATDEGLVTAMDAASGEPQWQVQLDGISGYLAPPAVEHDEVHLLDSDSRLHHLAVEDGSEVFVGELPAALAFPELDDGLVLVEELGVVTAIDLQHRERWGLETGANGVDRFTRVEVFRNLAIALTYSETLL